MSSILLPFFEHYWSWEFFSYVHPVAQDIHAHIHSHLLDILVFQFTQEQCDELKTVFMSLVFVVLSISNSFSCQLAHHIKHSLYRDIHIYSRSALSKRIWLLLDKCFSTVLSSY